MTLLGAACRAEAESRDTANAAHDVQIDGERDGSQRRSMGTYDMGLVLARMANALSGSGGRTAVATLSGVAVATGLVVTAQFSYGEDFSKRQTAPSAFNHAFGGGLAAGTVLAEAGMWVRTDRMSLPIAGFGLGALAGAYLITPAMRRAASED